MWSPFQVFDGDISFGKYCGTALPDPILSITNSLTVHFHSDLTVNERGFHVTYWETEVKGKRFALFYVVLYHCCFKDRDWIIKGHISFTRLMSCLTIIVKISDLVYGNIMMIVMACLIVHHKTTLSSRLDCKVHFIKPDNSNCRSKRIKFEL